MTEGEPLVLYFAEPIPVDGEAEFDLSDAVSTRKTDVRHETTDDD